MALKPDVSRWRAIHWVFCGLAVLALLLLGGGGLLVWAAADMLDTDRDLKDFASPAQARDFVSAHLPTPLPSTAVVEQLHYDSWQDFRLTARVRLGSPAAVASYIGQARLERTLNDAYCGTSEPNDGVDFFLAKSSACGSARPVVADSLEIACNTR
jgi:hypothetical protein